MSHQQSRDHEGWKLLKLGFSIGNRGEHFRPEGLKIALEALGKSGSTTGSQELLSLASGLCSIYGIDFYLDRQYAVNDSPNFLPALKECVPDQAWKNAVELVERSSCYPSSALPALAKIKPGQSPVLLACWASQQTETEDYLKMLDHALVLAERKDDLEAIRKALPICKSLGPEAAAGSLAKTLKAQTAK